ncbi:hypothetical protein L7F22_057944 [Adiantum nelumboides]|nr:hypothetical protein [Adiantum nelumboides]
MSTYKFEDSVVRFDFTSGRVNPLGKRFIIDNLSNTTIHSAPLKYCHTCKKDTGVGEISPYLDVLPGMDESDNVDWVHLVATIDTWGNRGTTWVTPEGNQLPQFVPLNMIRAVFAHSKVTRAEILTNKEPSSISEGCKSCDLMVESTIEISSNFELDEEVNTGSCSTPSDNLSWTEEDPSEDHSTNFALGTTHNHKLDKRHKKYKSILNTYLSASKLEGRQVVEQPMYMQQVLSIAEGISKELDQQQEQLAKLEELKKELEHLKNSPDATPRDIDCKELEVQAITKVLAKVGASSESLNMKQDLDALLEKRDALEDEAKLLIAPQAFMDKATKFIQRKGKASMVPTPPATASTLKPITFVGGSCAACGKPLSANHMAGVFLLTCQHKYHPFCFAMLCTTSTGCSHPNCKEKIPKIVKCWALKTAYIELGETKDSSCCLDSYDEDHSDRSDSFQMKGTASDDIANVLQGMAKVTTENSPILVLEPSGKIDNASTLVEDKDKNSTVDPPINFSIDIPPVHEGEDHEKNTTLDPVSKVSIDSAEGDHGKDKIVDPASKLSVDNPKVKIRVVNYPSSKSLDDSDTPINIDRVPPVYRSLGRPDACNDASRPAIILDLNNVLMITHRKSRDPLPPNVSSLYFYIIKDKEDRDITYYVRADAALFILHASQLAKVFIWSSCTLTNPSRRIDRCFSQVKVCFSGWEGQEMCHRASWQMGEKPVFFKSLETFLKGMQGLGKYSTLLLDDSSYKNHLNEKGTYVVLPGIEQQSEEQWDGFLKNDVLQFLYTWVDAKEEDRFKIVKE